MILKFFLSFFGLILSGCAQKQDCSIELASDRARTVMQKKIESDIYEVHEVEISAMTYKFYLHPPSGGTGFAPLMIVDRKTCKAKVIAWHR